MIKFNDWRKSGEYYKYYEFDIWYRHHITDTNKPTLLLLHGYPTASWDWQKVWDALAKHYNLITYDYLGYGSSDKPKHHEYSTSEQANICELLLDTLNINHCFVLAHDYGDTVLQELIARQNKSRLPFTIQSAVMLNGGIFVAANRPILIQRLMISRIGWLVGYLNNRPAYAANLQRVFSPNNKLSRPEVSELWKMTCYNNGRTLLPTLQRYLIERETYKERWGGALIHSSCPLLFISGELDTISGKHMREYYEQHVPNANTVALEDIAHYPQLENPEAVVTHTLAFLKSANTHP